MAGLKAAAAGILRSRTKVRNQAVSLERKQGYEL
jgi:hypothetical protein